MTDSPKKRRKTKVETYSLKPKVAQDEDGRWSAWIDTLPGCAAWGYSKDEAFAALRDMVQAYIEVMRDEGEEIPKEEAGEDDTPIITVTITTTTTIALSLSHSQVQG